MPEPFVFDLADLPDPPRRPGAPLQLDSLDSALVLLRATVVDHPDAVAVALVDAPPVRGGMALPAVWPLTEAEAITGLHDVVARALHELGGGRLVLASVRPERPGFLRADDDEQWARLRGRHEGSRCRLLDWLVVGPTTAVSFARLLGPTPWEALPPAA